MEIAFGPVSSRRLGRSLGINNIPPKHCSYACRYCQVGSTPSKEILPRSFYSPETIFQAVSQHLQVVKAQGEFVDFLTFVSDGEPTLDSRLSESIAALRPLGLPIAIISNASLIYQPGVRAALHQADWVCLKVDSVEKPVWRRINQPHPELQLTAILDGISTFSKSFSGILFSETMLLEGINDNPSDLKKLAAFLAGCRMQLHYLAIPVRPSPCRKLYPPSEITVNNAYQCFVGAGLDTELITSHKGDVSAFSGDLQRDILTITAVHPLCESAMRKLVTKYGGDMAQVDVLIDSGKLRAIDYNQQTFFVRKLT